mgnify:FL=1|tara:strand:- start:524 stop:988 length:465 start_codon:yes stop_codon:yes gene_type:complete
MNNVNSFIVDWSIRFLENKDSIKKEIVNIEKDKGKIDFIINYKDKVNCFIVAPILDYEIFDRIKNESYYGIFTLNNKANIRFVVSNWKKLIAFKFLNIHFINPFSSSDKLWTINPTVHEKICDKSSLELGLEAMAEMVEIIGLEELNNKVKLLK